MAYFTLKDVDRGWEKIKRFASERKLHAKAGVLGDGKKNKRKGDPLTNLEIAVIHEFGAPNAGIPERSFVRSSFELHHGEYVLLLRRMLALMLEHKLTARKAMELLGARMANDMKNLITTEGGHPVALAPETVKRKGSNVPLVDTGQLVNSITWAVGGEAPSEGGHHE